MMLYNMFAWVKHKFLLAFCYENGCEKINHSNCLANSKICTIFAPVKL